MKISKFFCPFPGRADALARSVFGPESPRKKRMAGLPPKRTYRLLLILLKEQELRETHKYFPILEVSRIYLESLYCIAELEICSSP